MVAVGDQTLEQAGGCSLPRQRHRQQEFLQCLCDRIAFQRAVHTGTHHLGVLRLKFTGVIAIGARHRFAQPLEVGHALLARKPDRWKPCQCRRKQIE